MKRLLLIFALSVSGALAEDPMELVKALRTEVRTEAKALPQTSDAKDTRRSELFQTLGSLLGMLASDEATTKGRQPHYVFETLAHLQVLSDSPKVQELCERLMKEFSQRANQNARACTEKLTHDLRQALLSGFSATSIQELDAPLNLVAQCEAMERRGDNNPDVRRVSELVFPVRQILLDCQNALMVAQGMSPPPGMDYRASLLRNVDSFTLGLARLVPASEFLEKVHAFTRILPEPEPQILTQDQFEDKIAALAKSGHALEDMAGIDQKITALVDHQRQHNNGTPDFNSAQEFHSWYASYQAVRSGAPVSRFDYTALKGFTKIEQLLRPLVLARVLELPPDLSQKESENVNDFLVRAFKTSCSTSNWAVGGRVMELAQFLGVTFLFSYHDNSAYYRMRSADSEDRSSLYALAVCDYLDAAACGSQVIPMDQVARRLQEIHQQHAQDYADGVQRYKDREVAEAPSNSIPAKKSSPAKP